MYNMSEKNDLLVKITKLSNAIQWILWKFRINVIFNSLRLESVLFGDCPNPRLLKKTVN